MPRHLIGDAHEWINEIPTVPTRSRVNLQPSQRSWILLVCGARIWGPFCIVPCFLMWHTKTLFKTLQQRGKKTLLSLTLICYCHLVGMVKRKRQYLGTTMKHLYLTIWLTNCTIWNCLNWYCQMISSDR